MLRTRLLRSTTLALLALAVSCSSDSSTAPEVVRVDLGQALTELSMPAVSGLVRGFAPASVGNISAPVPGACVYAASSQNFVCPTVSTGGLTVSQSYVLLSSAGTPQTQFNQGTTAAIRTSTSLAGTTSNPGMTLVIDQQQQLTLSGLLTGRHLINGTSVLRMKSMTSRVGGPGLDTLVMTVTTTTTDLAVPSASAGANAYPASGTMTMDMTVNDSGILGTSTTRAVLTFNGTSKVTMTFDVGGVIQRCTIDLASAMPTCS